MRKTVLKTAIAAVVLPFSLAGCATFHQAHLQQARAEQSIAHYQPPKAPPVVQTVNTPYLLGSMIRVTRAVPQILRQPVTLVTAQPMTLRQFASWVTSRTGVAVSTDAVGSSGAVSAGSTLPPLPSMSGGVSNPLSAGQNAHPLSLHYTGTLDGLLDTVAAQEGVWWHFRGGRITFFRTETRTFSIPALAWRTSASGSIVASTGASSGGSGMSGGAGGMPSGGAGMSGGAGGQSGESSGATSIVNTSKIDVWAGLQKTAQVVAGNGASVEADASTSSITVTGTPPQIDHVRQWVRGLNRQLSRQVAITVHVYNVQVNNEQNYGINLSGAFNGLGKQYGVSMQGVAPPTPAGNVSPMSLGANILSTATGAAGQWHGSSVAVQALATLGNVTQVFSQSTTSLNGQPAPIQVAQQTVYLAENSTTQTANVGSTSGLIPGTVTTGFTAMFLPRIVDGRIYMGMNMTISNLVGIQTITSGGNSIQAPTIDSSTFQQSVKLKPGQSLLLTGFQQKGGDISRNGVGSPYLPLLGGGANANTSNQMIAIVITARIL